MKNKLNHLALIPDGNGRWAANRNQSREHGHLIGYEVILKMVYHCYKLKIPYVTIYTLSHDNISKRNEPELVNIYALIKRFSEYDVEKLHKLNCVFNPIGDFSCLKNKEAVKEIELMRKKTQNNTGMVVHFAIGYAGMQDIAQSVLGLYDSLDKKLPNTSQAIMDGINKFSYLNDSPPVDLCIRLGGEQRISNFCLWQLAYAEFEFLEKLWPDFTEEDLDKCIADYNQRDRRFGTETAYTLRAKQ